jgi:hypothetical protein
VRRGNPTASAKKPKKTDNSAIVDVEIGHVRKIPIYDLMKNNSELSLVGVSPLSHSPHPARGNFTHGNFTHR